MTVRPFKRYRPEKSRDDDYGYSESLGDPITVYGQVSWHENELEFIYGVRQDIQIDDIIESDDGVQYRVIGEAMPSGALRHKVTIEREERHGKS